MKKIAFIAAISAMLWSCSADEPGTGRGCVTFQVSINSSLSTMSRSADDLARSAKITVSNANGVVRQFNGLDSVPTNGVWLVSDSYVVKATAGDSVAASWDARYFKGEQQFVITAGCSERVDVNCKIANTAVSVVIDSATCLTNAVVTAGTTAGQLEWTASEQRRGYFMLPSADSSISFNLKAVDGNGIAVTASGTIEKPQPATEYVLHVRKSATPTGSATGLIIEVDSRLIEVEDNIILSLPPEIQGIDFDLNQPVTGTKGAIGARYLLVNCCAGLKSATVSNQVIGTVDLLTNVETGVIGVYEKDEDLGTANMLIEIGADMLNSLDEGTHDFAFAFEDENGLKASANLKIIVTSVPMIFSPVKETDVWATEATLHALVVGEASGSVGFKYREKDTETWQQLLSQPVGSELTGVITSLKPNTAYEAKAFANDFETPVQTFKTETALTLPNAGFENWQTQKSPFLVYGDGQEMFWDCGNKGSSMLNKNVTVPDTEIKHSGSYSAKLSSQFVGVGKIGKFAAGNLFVGQYLETVGTDGVLGWGRSWTSRPKALKGYIRYIPGEIEYENSDCPDRDLIKGKPDQAIIYIAILDDTKEQYKEFSFPVIVKTKAAERKLFDSNEANVIAYGQKIFTSATAGSGMVEFEIPLTYRAADRKAMNIMIVAAASRGGDYFVGGNSTMWLDDLELVY